MPSNVRILDCILQYLSGVVGTTMDDDSSFIARRLKQTGGLLLGGAQKQVNDYKGKFESLKGVYEEFMSKLLISYDSATFDPKFVDKFSEVTTNAIDTFNVHKSSGVFSWGTTRHTLKRNLSRAKKATTSGVTVNDMLKMLSGDERVICISIADPETLRELVITLTKNALKYRKRRFEIKPQILFVFDEAQEFIPSKPKGQLERCSYAVERLLRQGRKYGLGGVIATQRIAYLNTNILQQLHTFFVGTLPRPYDRTVVSSSFQIDLSILDKTLEFPPGSWLLSSYIATGLDNVPVFVKADNSEDTLKEHIDKVLKPPAKTATK